MKTQISFAANLVRAVRGRACGRRDRVRHVRAGAGFSRGQCGELEKSRLSTKPWNCWDRSSSEKPEGYAIDRRYPDILYVPEDSEFSVREGSVRWKSDGASAAIDAARRHHLRAPQWFSAADGEAIGRLGVAARRRAPARNALPQALHRFGRRQIGNFEVDRQRDSGRAGLCGRLINMTSSRSPRY